jgi:hypothetical protein
MVNGLRRIAISAVLLLFAIPCSADPIVWLDDKVDLNGRTTFYLSPVRDETGKKFDIDPAAIVFAALLDGLRTGDMKLLEQKGGTANAAIAIEARLMDYETGSAVDRWAFPGLGATWCVVRAILSDPASGRVLGEVVSHELVSAGGLFSIGAEERVPKNVGREIAEAITSLVNKARDAQR